MGLGNYSCTDELSLGMHGTVYTNYAVDSADLLLAFDVRCDDRVTGKIEAFASRAKIVHIDIDAAEIGKNKQPHVSICADIKLALKGNSLLEKRRNLKFDFSAWREEPQGIKKKYPLSFKNVEEAIPPQDAIQVLNESTDVRAIVSTGVGQHQMWSAQWYQYKDPRHWLTSCGLGAMGFGLSSAIGDSVAKPNAIVVDIDGDGSFIMNCQELAMVRVYNLPIKIIILNNQCLGMDRDYKGNRAHTYLGNPENEFEIFPNMVKLAEAFQIPGCSCDKETEVREAIRKMLETPWSVFVGCHCNVCYLSFLPVDLSKI